MNKTSISQFVKKYTLMIALAVVILIFSILTSGSILNPQNINNLISQNAYVIILAVGMLMTILTGGNVDLSVGSIVAMIGAVAGKMMVTKGMNIFLTMFVCLFLGVVIGMLQGFIIAYIKVPPFIATLGGMMIWRGVALIILDGFTISPYPDTYLKIFNSYLPNIFKSYEKLDLTCLLIGIVGVIAFAITKIGTYQKEKKQTVKTTTLAGTIGSILIIGLIGMFVTYKLAIYRGLPMILIYILIIIAIYHYYTSKTVAGRYLYAVGGNEKAAKLSGIDTERVYFKAYTNMGFLSGLAALVVVARFNAASPTAGTGYEMDAIASVFLGGASAYGGTGSVIGAVIGALFMGVLNNGMSIMGIDANWQRVVKGTVLLAAVIFDVTSKRKKS
ncbi:MAG: sugar ABC transporter permease [Clostridiaceae bacterium]|nr:sugar ABC transporter permease [Clostridiaceae bacterium]